MMCSTRLRSAHRGTNSVPMILGVFLCAIVLLLGSPAKSTWNKVAQINGIGHVSASWFFNPRVGLIGFNGISTPNLMQRTTDGGVTWNACNIPTLSPFGAPFITDIWFADTLNGWATMFSGTTDPHLWRTTDGGLNWVGVPAFLGKSPSSVRQTSSSLVVAQSQGVGVSISTDSGKTWTASFNTYKNGLDFVDDLHGALTAYKGQFLYTSDGGRNWNTSLINFTHEGWGVFGIKHTPFFVAVTEDSVPAGGSRVYRSTNDGINWSLVQQLPFRSNGAVQGIGNIIYIQNSNTIPGKPAGLYRSTDMGSTWVNVGGPNEDVDIRFAVTGCGNVVYAFDNTGGVYKTTDAGDGTPLAVCVFNNVDTLRPAISSICDSVRNKYYLHNPNVGDVVVTDIRIFDSLRRPTSTTAFYVDSLPAPQELIRPGDSIAFQLGWRPIRLMDSTGRDSAVVRVIFFASYISTYDTVYYPIKLSGFSQPPNFILSTKGFRADSILSCATLDSTYRITNVGCDTLTITKALLQFHNTWTLTDSLGAVIKPPYRLASGRHLDIHLRTSPRSTKLTFDSLMVTMHYQGRDSSIGAGFRMTGKLNPPLAGATPSAIVFDSIAANCATTDSLITINNTACDTIFIRKTDLSGGDWTVLDANGGPVQLPIVLLPGKTGSFKLHFAPKLVGASSGQLAIHYHFLDGFDSTNIITLTGAGVPAGTLSYSRTLDFGNVPICSAGTGGDTVMVFHNTSCVDALVDSLKLPAPFTNLDANLLPITVKSGQSQVFHIHFNVGTKTRVTAKAQLIYFVQLPPVKHYDTLTVTGNGIGGASTFEASPGLAPIAFAAKTECDKTDSVSFAISNSGCDTMTVTGLTVDGNLAATIDPHIGGLPAMVVNGKPLTLTVAQSKLIAGSYTGNVHVQFKLANGSIHDSLIPVSFSVGRGPRRLAVAQTKIDFGNIRSCVPHDTTLVLISDTCGTVTVNSRTIAGSGFRATYGAPDPIYLATGQQDVIHIHYDGTTLGALSSQLTIKSNSDQNPDQVITILGQAPATDSVHFLLSFSKMPVRAGDFTNLIITPDRAVNGIGLHSIAGVIVYHGDAFVAGTPTTANGLSLRATGVVRVGMQERVSFEVSSPSGIALSKNAPIFTLPLKAVVGDSVGVNVTLDSITLNGTDKSFGDCVLASNPTTVASQYSVTCGDSSVIRYMRGQPIIAADVIHPNPVTPESGYQSGIHVKSAVNGLAEISLMDALGRTVSRETRLLKASEVAAVSFDLHDQAAGTYFYEVHFSSPEGTGRLTGSVMIVK